MAYKRQTVKYVLYCIFFQLLTSSFVTAKKRVNFRASLMSRDEVIDYFKSFVHKSSLDMKNEKQLTLEDHAEDLYNKIDGLMSKERYLKLLEKTRAITDKEGRRKYLSFPGTPCNPSSIFKPALQSILMDWDKSNVLDELEKWQMKNEHLSDSEQCNRFKGLTCQNGGASIQISDNEKSSSTATCQCDGDPSEVEYFESSVIKNARKQQDETYPDGCYVKPWQPCTHLFSQDSSKTILAQIIFPVGRTNKCKDGSNCLDLIPGMNRPICWCNKESIDEDCMLTKNRSLTDVYIPPLDAELLANRRKFLRMVIAASDKRTACNPEYNKDITKLAESAGMNPSKSGAVTIMEKLVGDAYPGKKIRICDFRKALLCDAETRKCKQHLSCGTSLCGPSYICGEKSGKKVCLPDCTSPIFKGSEECSEDLVKRAKGLDLIDLIGIPDDDLFDPAASHSEGFKDSLDQPPALNSRQSILSQADPNNQVSTTPTTETTETSETTMIAKKTPKPKPKQLGIHGSACLDKSDCDYQKFLACYGGTCDCVPGLVYSVDHGSCEVLTNEPCEVSDQELSGVPSEPRQCYSGLDHCQVINEHSFCRPKNEESPMFISKAKLDELKAKKQAESDPRTLENTDTQQDTSCKCRSMGSYAGILRSSNFLMAAICIRYLMM